MKKAFKLIAIILFVWAMASCSKENDPGNGSGNGNGTEQFNYSYGYYHPAKKIKKVTNYSNIGNYEFIWDGDNLSSIIYKRNSSDNAPKAIYHFEYNSDGRISCIWDSTDMDNPTMCTYKYYSNKIEVRGIDELDYTDYKIVNGEVYCRGIFGEFNFVGYIHDVSSNDYDQANNPFKDLGLSDFMFDPVLSDNHEAWSFHNRIADEGVNDSWYRYDYDNDNYPTACWYTNPSYYGNSTERIRYRITYYPMGGNGGYGSYNGHDYVDLGLPSHTLWATCDLGADSPEACGDKYAWGETNPKSSFSWRNYKYCNGSEETLTKYCPWFPYGYNGYEDNLTTLQPCDDAATVNWGNGWRTPTKEELYELFDYYIVNTTHVDQNGVEGYLLTGPNGNIIFLSFDENTIGGHENYGAFWSSELQSESDPREAYSNSIGSGYSGYGCSHRYRGHRIRPVCTARQQ